MFGDDFNVFDVLQSLASLVVVWNVWIHNKIIKLDKDLALNTQSDKNHIEAIKDIKDLMDNFRQEMKGEIKELRNEIQELYNRKK